MPANSRWDLIRVLKGSNKGKGKGTAHPRTDHECPEGE